MAPRDRSSSPRSGGGKGGGKRSPDGDAPRGGGRGGKRGGPDAGGSSRGGGAAEGGRSGGRGGGKRGGSGPAYSGGSDAPRSGGRGGSSGGTRNGPDRGGPPSRGRVAGGPRGGRSAPDRAPAPARADRPGHTAATTDPTPPRHYVYGRNPVREAMRGRRKVKRIWATKTAASEGWGTVKVKVVEPEEVEARAGTDAHQGVVAEVEPYPYVEASELLAVENPVIVALDEVTDPQNLGAICRSAECAGATGVVIPERRSAEVTAAVCKASAGAVEHLPIARVRNLADFLTEAKEAGCWSYGASANGTTSYLQPDYQGGVVLVMGAEGKGLRPRVEGSCDALVSLPLHGRIDSLNVSATAAVLLYAILQRRLDTST